MYNNYTMPVSAPAAPQQQYASAVPQQQYQQYAAPMSQQYAPQQQYATPAPQQGYAPPAQKEVKDKIAAVYGGKKKVLDARNGLVLAYPDDYAALHGAGGSKHAPVSVIKLTLCDPSVTPSVTVSANVPPDMFEVFADVAKQNMIQWNVPVQSGAGSVWSVFFPQGAPTETVPLPMNGDYAYSQVRVNTYKTDQNGYCPVTALTITRQGYYKGKRNMPWTVKISAFKAQYNTAPNGTTSYIGSTAVEKKEVFIQISDEDFYKFTKRIDRFVRVWEHAMCEKQVADGTRLRDEFRNNR